MTAQNPPARLLIIDIDARLVEMLSEHFAAEGYQVSVALDGRAGLALAQQIRPNLVLLATRLNDMAGLDVFRTLRDTPRTSRIPVMMMGGQREAVLQHKILEEGAYDFIEKPLDLDILSLSVRNALRRAERDGLHEPRTGLPTGRLIDERLNALDADSGWTRLDLHIDAFGVFRDLYGFVTANEALRFAANLIAQIVAEHGSPDDFVGHFAGTETFVIVTTDERAPALSEQLARRVGQELRSFYSFVEREQGYVLLEDGAGGVTPGPLMAVRVTTAHAGAAGAPPDPATPPRSGTAAPTDNAASGPPPER